jgi:hypothetical protein
MRRYFILILPSRMLYVLLFYGRCSLRFANRHFYLFNHDHYKEYWKDRSASSKTVPRSSIWQHCASDGCCDSALVN